MPCREIIKRLVAKFGRSKVEANGVLPWQIGVYSAKLTDAFARTNWDEVRQYSALWRISWRKRRILLTRIAERCALRSLPGADERFDTISLTATRCFSRCGPNDAALHRIRQTTHLRIASARIAGCKLFCGRPPLPRGLPRFHRRILRSLLQCRPGAVVIRQLSLTPLRKLAPSG